MKFFENGLARLVIICVNDLACEAAKFCKEHSIDVAVVSSPRFRDLPTLLPEKGLPGTCDGRMKSLGFEIDEVSSIKNLYLKKYVREDAAAFSFDSSFIIKQPTIDLFGGRIFNAHWSRLPLGKGGGNFSWRILEDDREGYVVFHIITEGIDDGPLVNDRAFLFPDSCIKPIDYMIYQLDQNLRDLKIFLKALIDNEDVPVVPQHAAFSSYLPRLNTPIQGYINWDWSVRDIRNFILAFSDPYEGAKTFCHGIKCFIKNCYVDTKAVHTHPFKAGIVFKLWDDKLFVACRDGTLVVTEHSLDGGKSVTLGDRFFTPHEVLEKSLVDRVHYGTHGLKE